MKKIDKNQGVEVNVYKFNTLNFFFKTFDCFESKEAIKRFLKSRFKGRGKINVTIMQNDYYSEFNLIV